MFIPADIPTAIKSSSTVTIQESPSAEAQTVIIVSLVVVCSLALVLMGATVLLVKRRMRELRVGKCTTAGHAT
ncbi:hypothetical protein QQS21_007052 [Conoideocrella luteorostrata]|uniref:Uncharacterized protein n=1 Tax=Conoideocrella luteorostrata TaxID=1105319 RepID=A0AAJ0CLH6_9HYPO|nr:hypothetical protein QQS21_007052 [Conoideocrella luteorostrata]